MMKEVYITHAKRTAVSGFLGGLSNVPAPLLGANVIKAILAESGIDPQYFNDLILGQVLTGGSGQNPARQSLIHAGLPKELTATTINKVCGSGLKAVALAANSVKAGEGDLILAGGQENMSQSMHGMNIRNGNKFGNAKLVDLMMHDGLTDAFSGQIMGITAENIAEQFGIGRQDQDQLAYNSQMKAARAQKSGKFKDEIVPISVQNKKETINIDQDEGIRANTTIETLGKLKAAFKNDGTVTAGNSSTINDGAACLLVASAESVKKHNLTPIARIVSYASCGVNPTIMGIGPVPASRLALEKAGWQAGDLDLIEANEAFAVQAEYVNRQMKWDTAKVNVNGGAIALGHPIGASGARILVTLLHEMKRSKANKALATLCIGGGMGISMCLERS
jgi:acetyl-CoA C-acetyltransferase